MSWMGSGFDFEATIVSRSEEREVCGFGFCKERERERERERGVVSMVLKDSAALRIRLL